jgi:DNA-binding NtrC family response regulator
MTDTKKVLIVDDEIDIARFISRVAEDLGFESCVATDAEAFKESYDAFKPDIVVLDVVMPEVDGIELVKFLASRDCTSRILVISGYAQRYLNNAKALGEAFGLEFITAMAKPIDLPQLEEFLLAA